MEDDDDDDDDNDASDRASFFSSMAVEAHSWSVGQHFHAFHIS